MRISIYLGLFLISITSLFSQSKDTPSFLRYYEYSTSMMQAPDAAFKFGLYGYSNPAITSYLHDADMQLTYASNASNDLDKIGVFTGSQNSGFGLIYGKYQDLASKKYEVYDYRYSFAFGGKNLSFGLGYGFVGGDKSKAGRSNSWQWSFLYRPNGNISLSGGQTRSIDKNDYETNAQVAIRPIASYPLALFADASLYRSNSQDLGDIFDDENGLNNALRYSYGISWEFIRGIRANYRMFSKPFVNGVEIDGDYYSFGLDLSMGTYGLSAMMGSNSDNKLFQSFTYRTGAKDRSLVDDLGIVFFQYYVSYNLSGTIKYQRSPFFDNSSTLLNILQDFENIKNSKSIRGIVINATGFSANPSISWEIREKLKELKKAGKRVIIFIERTGLEGYHFASVADEIVMDEMGTVSPSGYVLGGSYYKNMLEKLKIGYEELRLFKYKSAAERFAREDMSEGQREQLQALIDSWYKTTTEEIVAGRPQIEIADVDKLVNDKLFYFTSELKEKKFIDVIGRWTDKSEVIKEIDKSAIILPQAFISVQKPEPFDDKWGSESDGIAVIYVVGICAMDEGINARKLVESVKSAVEDNDIKAIVLRVDSPGGDALASEYIAKVVRDNKDKKPIIVSQGMLAASGGYWLSMDANKILSSPKTITGSIGVISSWMYDKGASTELGITTDKVQKGKYADLGYSWGLPIIGLGLPTRDLTADERKQWEGTISTMYEEFITKVAKGRGKEKDSIHQVAQGRVWTGADALNKGLVDEIGGLDAAIKLARKEAGYADDELQQIYEFPEPTFDFTQFLGGIFGFNLKSTIEKANLLKFRAEHNGVPMTLVPIDFWQYYVNE